MAIPITEVMNADTATAFGASFLCALKIVIQGLNLLAPELLQVGNERSRFLQGGRIKPATPPPSVRCLFNQ